MDGNLDFDRIDQYLNQEMDDATRKSFEEELKGNENLANEFEKRQMAHRLLDFAITKNLKEQLKELEEQSSIIDLRQRRKRRIYTLSIAASVLILVGVFSIFRPSSQLSGDQLAGNFYTNPDYSLQRDNDTLNLTDLEKQLRSTTLLLEAQNYDQAIAILESIPDTADQFIQVQYNLAHAYYAKANYDKAQSSFQIVAESQDFRLEQEAEWYELLSCLAQNKECQTLLNQILAQDEHEYQEEALKISKKLK